MRQPSAMCNQAPNEERSPAMEALSPRRRILVIDHNDDIREILCNHLNAIGFEAAAEADGASGLSRIASDHASRPFHGVLVELEMPILGGLAVLQELRKRFPSIPVIIMSDATHVAKLRQAMTAGAKEYLVKPFDSGLFRHKCVSIFLDGKNQAM